MAIRLPDPPPPPQLLELPPPPNPAEVLRNQLEIYNPNRFEQFYIATLRWVSETTEIANEAINQHFWNNHFNRTIGGLTGLAIAIVILGVTVTYFRSNVSKRR